MADINRKRYMESFLGYQPPIPELLLTLFCYKLVHLAEPKAVLEYEAYPGGKQVKKGVTWMYTQGTPQKHLPPEGVMGRFNFLDRLALPLSVAGWGEATITRF